MRPIHFLASLLVGAICNQAVSARPAAAGSVPFAHSTQMIVVTTADWNAVDGQLQRYERGDTHEGWRAVGEPIPIVVGKNGMGWGIGLGGKNGPGVRRGSDPIKKEGDGKSPAGVFALGTAFGDAPQALPGLKLPYLELTPSIECVDDPHSKFYNRVLDRNTVAPDWHSSEHMRNVGEAYRWGIVVGHNGGAAQSNDRPPIPGGGSCVFLHIWSGPGHGTAGCTAMAQSNLETLLLWLDPKREPILVQLPAAEYARMSDRWGLPRFGSAPAH
jgi:D-alanyl-D-alanine dipeptidase